MILNGYDGRNHCPALVRQLFITVEIDEVDVEVDEVCVEAVV
jgi:hypothetical protein